MQMLPKYINRAVHWEVSGLVLVYRPLIEKHFIAIQYVSRMV